MRLRFFLALVGIGLVACGSSDDSTSGTLSTSAQNGSAADWPACTYDPAVVALESADGGAAPVTVTRTYVTCSVSGGGGEGCASNDPTSCSDDGTALGGGTESSCKALCSADEFAASYSVLPQPDGDGGFVVPTAPTLPAACRSLLANPGGGVTLCCPCAP